MNNQKGMNISPYVTEPLRLEYRWAQPYKRIELERALKILKDVGIKAWWIGVMGSEGALFESSVMPVDPDLKDDVLPWLSKECAKSGITLITHYSFEPGGYNGPILREHPEWGMQFLRNEDGEELSFEERLGVCPHSPYMELMEEFVQEVIEKLGLKGFWFDSAPLTIYSKCSSRSPYWVGCCCPRCAERFHQETGYTMPIQIDWESVDFRAFVDWRYAETAEIWRRMAAAVRRTNSSAFVAINTYRRLGLDWHTASCLQPLDFPVLVGGEDDRMGQQVLLQIKYQRAMCNTYPPEVWQGLYSMPDPVALPNPEPEGRLLQQGLACMTAGGFPSYGTGAHPALVCDTLKTLGRWLKSRSPWVGGEPLRYAGIVLSRHTQDFSRQGKADKAWNSVHGMHEILNQLHLPSEVLFDEHLEKLEYLSKYPLIILPEITCLSDKAAIVLEDYVHSGGHLLTTGATGTLNFRGERRDTGVLDKLLGISSREQKGGHIYDKHDYHWDAGPDWIRDGLREQKGGHPVLIPEPKVGKDLPKMYAVFGEPCKIRASVDSEVWAHFFWLPTPSEKEADWTERNQEHDYDAIIVRHFGRGRTIFLAWDIGGGFLGAARKRTRLLMGHVLADGPALPYRIQAPPWLVVTAWRQTEDRLVFHLLQGQGSPARFPEKKHYTVLEDIPLLQDVKISLSNQRVSRAWMPLSGLELSLSQNLPIVTATVPIVERHEIVVFEH